MMTSYLTPAPSTGGGLGLRAVLGFYSLQPVAGSLAWAADAWPPACCPCLSFRHLLSHPTAAHVGRPPTIGDLTPQGI